MMLKHVRDDGKPGDPDAAARGGADQYLSVASLPGDDRSKMRTEQIGAALYAILADMPRSGVRGI
jgi:hypothetical protein